MGYFRELPNIEYQSFLNDSTSSKDYILVKNLFRRTKLRDDLLNVVTLFNKYQIPDNSRPDLVAEELYGSPDYDWVVLISAGIINIRDQWPLSDKDLYEFALKKYGNDLTEIKHYETVEVRDANDRLILPSGKIVDPNFTIPKPDKKDVTINPVAGVTNYEYEVKKNEEKRTVYLLKPEYLQQFLNDMRIIMSYEQSSQYVSPTLIKTENTKSTMP
jgi:hypothetical protein